MMSFITVAIQTAAAQIFRIVNMTATNPTADHLDDPNCEKNNRTSTDILWRVFHILTEPRVPYTSVSANRRNNEALAHIAMPN